MVPRCGDGSAGHNPIGSPNTDDDNARLPLPRRHPTRARVSAAVPNEDNAPAAPPRISTRIRKREDESHRENDAAANNINQLPAAARKRVRGALSVFEAIYRKLSRTRPLTGLSLRAYKQFSKSREYRDLSRRRCVGAVPGIEVGDEFNLRVELCVVGLHYRNRIPLDFVQEGDNTVAISLVYSRPYVDGAREEFDAFEYSCSGDMKLAGNLALRNNMDARTPVRVIHGLIGYRPSNSRETKAMNDSATYVYGGLFLVEKYSRRKGSDGVYVCVFQFRRMAGQAELVMNNSKHFVLKDIYCGRERSDGELQAGASTQKIKGDEEAHSPTKASNNCPEGIESARQKVGKALSLFESIYKKLSKTRQPSAPDTVAYRIFNESNKELSRELSGKRYVGCVPGIEVGDEFNLRVELCIVGLHHPHRLPVDVIREDDKAVAISLVDSSPYVDGMGGSDVFEYSSFGDLKLAGNLALKNSMDTRTPVRVIHGFAGYQSSNSRETKTTWNTVTYIYAGMFVVEKYWRKKGTNGMYVSMFKFRRMAGQAPPPLPSLSADVDQPHTPAPATPPVSRQLHRRHPSCVRASAVWNSTSSCRRNASNSPNDSRSSERVRGDNTVTEAAESRARATGGKRKRDEESHHENDIGSPAKIRNNHSEVTAAARQKISEALSRFESICQNLSQTRRLIALDMMAYKLFNERHKELSNELGGRKYAGGVPGIEVGDEFNMRVELCIAGLHRQHRLAVDFIREDDKAVAISLVYSRPYVDGMSGSDVFEYPGSGDLKLEGNLALKNSMDTHTPVRIIHGFKGYQPSNSRETKSATNRATYIYAGLFLVDKYWRKKGIDGVYVSVFNFRRMVAQPQLVLKRIKDPEITKETALKFNKHLILKDISHGKENIPIPVVNNIDSEQPRPFKYITQTIYPSRHSPLPPRGCNCINGCSDSERCSCAVKNGGEIPFNENGDIVEAKPLVYECGPSCKCPPSCHNRVSQQGIKFRLEIFKTELRGWGVRSQDQIPSGSFVCKYTGVLLDDQEADKRTNDEYLFDVGNNYYDEALWEGLKTSIPSLQKGASCEDEEVGFAVDAYEYGNVGRFVNHSCTPNLYAQNLLYDHDNKSMPHVVFFAAEDIPPMQELTYDYNYALDQVCDSEGNIKRKICYCGTIECTGRLY